MRVANTNHRTRRDDFDILVREVVRIGGEVVRGASHGLPIERARNVAALIRRFIRDLVAQRGTKSQFMKGRRISS